MVRLGSVLWACSLPSTTIARRSFDGTKPMTTQPIKTLFANDIHRRIEEVIKVDQTSDDILRDEINEYVVTDAIRVRVARRNDRPKSRRPIAAADAIASRRAAPARHRLWHVPARPVRQETAPADDDVGCLHRRPR